MNRETFDKINDLVSKVDKLTKIIESGSLAMKVFATVTDTVIVPREFLIEGLIECRESLLQKLKDLGFEEQL